MSYRPLPDYLTIRTSEINGLGLFTSKRIWESKVLGKSHYEFEGELFRTPLGGFYNHSDNPNCVKIKSSHANVYFLQAIREIEAGEEITVSYTFYDIRGIE